MNFLDGEQITRLKSRVAGMSPRVQKQARQRILHRIADAYGQMIISTGLFQADPHPGNIMVMKGKTSSILCFSLSSAFEFGFELKNGSTALKNGLFVERFSRLQCPSHGICHTNRSEA